MLRFDVLDVLAARLRAPRARYLLYALVYLACGLCMNALGKTLRIAEFAHWWQVFTCYVLYLVPASLLVRGRPWLEQYAWGVVALAPLELAGYAIGSSRAFEANVLDRILGERNFTLAMTVFFGGILPLGNAVLARLEARLLEVKVAPSAVASARADSGAA